jgi:hypothetical protein
LIARFSRPSTKYRQATPSNVASDKAVIGATAVIQTPG